MSFLKRIFGSAERPKGPGGDASLLEDRVAALASGDRSATGETNIGAAEVDALLTDGRYGVALARLDAALLAKPDDPTLWIARGRTLFAWGRAWEAQGAFLHAQAKGAQGGDIFLWMGKALLQTGRAKEAEPWIERALAAGAGWSESLCALVQSLAGQKRVDEAVRRLDAALVEHPDDLGCRLALGDCLIERGDYGGAEAHFRRAVENSASNAGAWVRLGVALDRQGRVDDAIIAFERAIEVETSDDRDLDLFVDLAITLHNLERKRETIALCERHLPARPSARGYFTYATALLAEGRLEDAWQYFDFRWLAEPQLSLRPKFQRLPWTGQDLRGKTILLHAEQGMGDVIQYVRYAPLVKALGATVFLVASRPLVKLMSGIPGVDRLLNPGEESPDFDFYVHLMSLPKIFRTGLTRIPANIPYLFADPGRKREAQAEVAREAGSQLKIGLVWSGSGANPYNLRRACPLKSLAPLFDIPGVRWFSLQRSGESLVTHDESDDVPLALLELRNDMVGTAALVDSLDLIVSVDTSIAHLAGALGRPVWVLLPRVPHWTWLDDRDDSPWYPTMRLFRQPVRGDWTSVVTQVKAALETVLEDRGASVPTQASPRNSVDESPLLPVEPSGLPGPGHRTGLGAVAETRHGIMQYLPDAGAEAVALCVYGEWLQAQLDVVSRALRPEATVLEIGAGIGTHALSIGKMLGDEGHLMLCEPRAPEQRILRQNIAANIVPNVTLVNSALGGPGSDEETVDSLRLTELHWLKITGAADAAAVLAGAADTLWRLRPSLWIEACDAIALERLADIAKAFGYRCWGHQSTLFSPGNYNRRSQDVFGGGLALALLAFPEEIELNVALPDCVEL